MRSTSELLIHSRETIGYVPPERIGASATVVGSKLYLFGGALPSATNGQPGPRSDLYVLDLELWKWEIIPPTPDDPVPRYFHTVEIWKNHLVVFGGLGAQNGSGQLQVLNDVRMFNLSSRRWVIPLHTVPAAAASPSTPIPQPRYAHLSCVSLNKLFIFWGQDLTGEALHDVCVYDLDKKEWIRKQYSPIPRLDMNHSFVATSQWHVRTPPLDATNDQTHSPALSYSDLSTQNSPCEIYLYTADHLHQKLEVLSPLLGGGIQSKEHPPAAGAPPFLHYPNGVILGKTLILAGNCSAGNAYSEHGFVVWTLDLETNIWSFVETGTLLKNGSWGGGYLWHDQNKFFAFGKLGGRTVDAADQRVLAWNTVAVVDLETLGIYQPPPPKLDAAGQRRGLALLADAKGADFEFLCEDGRRIPCSRRTILNRWPWFRDQYARLSSAEATASVKHEKRTEITITPTSAALSESYPVTMALVQYFYSLALATALQRAPAVLSHLLLISTEFQIPHLRILVTHAMHAALTEATAEGVYEIAASCGCRSLQLR
ncbi:galactose oxidase [Mycena polygramma]|nr:galactose oxidase [Mycena polygramma]